MLHSSQTVLSRVWPGRVRGTLLDATEGIRCNNEAVLGCSHDAQMRYFRGEGKANRHSGRRGEGRHGKGGGSKEEAPAQESRLFDLMSNPQNLTKKREAVLRVRTDGSSLVYLIGKLMLFVDTAGDGSNLH